MGSLAPEVFRPEFQAGLKDLLRQIFYHATPKSVGGTEMNGPMLAGAYTACGELRVVPLRMQVLDATVSL